MADAGELRRGRNAIRRQMRERRRALAPDARARADRDLFRHIARLPVFRAARRIGIFIAFDGEPDLEPLMALAARRHKRVYVPVLRGLHMQFVALPRDARMLPNFFGILEPARKQRIDPRNLDLVLTPLVAFDARGARLGVGRGYYDRRFAFLLRRNSWIRPKLLGVAYSFQEVPEIDVQPWDVTLWGVATEQGVRLANRTAHS
jgi:5-formyltetrahydrofolate cyclo-ligase